MDFRNLKEFLKDASVYILVIIFVLFVVNYVFTFQQNVGPSMSPTLENGDAFILNKLAYKVGKIKRGNVVVINNNDSKYLVKRVIGLPGETLEYKDHILYINGKKVDDKFASITNDFSLEQSFNIYKIPDNCYFVMGDNRGSSLDSRRLGCFTKDDIKGKVTFSLIPFKKVK